MTHEKKLKAYNVTERKDKDAYWNYIGRAFPFTSKDGREGFSIPSLNLVVLEAKDEDDEVEPDQSPA